MVKVGKRFKKRGVKSTFALAGEEGDELVFRGNKAPRKGDKQRRARGQALDQLGVNVPPPPVAQHGRLTRAERTVARLVKQAKQPRAVREAAATAAASKRAADPPVVAQLRELARTTKPSATTAASFGRAVDATLRAGLAQAARTAPRTSAKRVEKRRERSAARAEKRQRQADDAEEERRFRGVPEPIRFGEVAQAPPDGIDKWTQQLESMRVKMSAKRARVGSRADDGVE